MKRRSFLVAAGSSLASPMWRAVAGGSLGTLASVEASGIFVRELPDGRPVHVASGAGLHSPRFSPTGAWIRYQKPRGGVFVVRRDGRDTAALHGEGSMWLPDEDRLAVGNGSDVAIFSPSKQWKSPEVLWRNASIGPFSPDGRQYAAMRISDQQRADLYVAAEDRTLRVLIHNNEGEIRPYAWTRDAKQIIYWRAEEWSASIMADGMKLYSIPAAGGTERKLGVSSLVHADMLDLAPGGASRLVVASGRGRETWAEQKLVLIDLGTGGKRDLTRPDVAAQGPVWSPDGQKIAYFAAPDAELAEAKAQAGRTVRIHNPDGSVTTRLRTSETRIGIGGGEEAHRFLQLRKIWVLDPANGQSPQQVTEDARYRDEEPVWSSDSSHILFARMDYDGRASLWLMERSGSNARQVCHLNVHRDSRIEEGWFGYYGYTDWRTAFDWRR